MPSTPPPPHQSPPHRSVNNAAEEAQARAGAADVRAQAAALAAEHWATAIANGGVAATGTGQLSVTDQIAWALALSSQAQNQQGNQSLSAPPQPLPAAAQQAQQAQAQAQARQVQAIQVNAQQQALTAQQIQAALGQFIINPTHPPAQQQQHIATMPTVVLPTGYPQIQQAPTAIMGAIVAPTLPTATIAGNLVGVVPTVAVRYGSNPATATANESQVQRLPFAVAPLQQQLSSQHRFPSAASLVQAAFAAQAAAAAAPAAGANLASSLHASYSEHAASAPPSTTTRDFNSPPVTRSADPGATTGLPLLPQPASVGASRFASAAVLPFPAHLQAIEDGRNRDEEGKLEEVHNGTEAHEEEKGGTLRVSHQGYRNVGDEALNGMHGDRPRGGRSVATATANTIHVAALPPAAITNSSNTESSSSLTEAATTALRRNSSSNHDQEYGGLNSRKRQREPSGQQERDSSSSPLLGLNNNHQEGHQSGPLSSLRDQQSGCVSPSLHGELLTAHGQQQQQQLHQTSPQASMSQSERKVYRERQRRSDLNRGFQNLMAALNRVDRLQARHNALEEGTSQNSLHLSPSIKRPDSLRGSPQPLGMPRDQLSHSNQIQQKNRVTIVSRTVEVLEGFLVREAGQVERERALTAKLKESERERLALIARLGDTESDVVSSNKSGKSSISPSLCAKNPNTEGESNTNDPKAGRSSNSK
uniref:Uncharacterized protein n=1 Tax=Odontella aurita TaxID=265563 RepID=A0A7S4JC76_9STRA|mmetsp:Transcript_43557/g.132571  ORF Transcript_43557/g.132571 Transcript_43557/m.132571 type:complete len:705 (+) Transcript_43557:100-2214(+)